MSAVSVAGIEVPPGERAFHVVHADVADRSVEVPIIVVNGRETGPRVAVTAGIHGAEYVGIEAARRLGMGIDPRDVRGSVVVVPVSNTTAFFRRSIYRSGLDDENLNRCFPGRTGASRSEALAHWIFHTIIEPSQYHIDLHGGDMIEALVPFVLYCAADHPAVERTSRDMALATGISRIIRSVTSGSTYGAAAAAGIPSILAEIGGQGVWDDDLVEQHRRGALSVLSTLGVVPGARLDSSEQRMYDTFSWLRAETDGLFHPAVHVGDVVGAGQHVGYITDYFGSPLQVFHAPIGGEIAFLVTSLAMNAGDPVLAIIR